MESGKRSPSEGRTRRKSIKGAKLRSSEIEVVFSAGVHLGTAVRDFMLSAGNVHIVRRDHKGVVCHALMLPSME